MVNGESLTIHTVNNRFYSAYTILSSPTAFIYFTHFSQEPFETHVIPHFATEDLSMERLQWVGGWPGARALAYDAQASGACLWDTQATIERPESPSAAAGHRQVGHCKDEE